MISGQEMSWWQQIWEEGNDDDEIGVIQLYLGKLGLFYEYLVRGTMHFANSHMMEYCNGTVNYHTKSLQLLCLPEQLQMADGRSVWTQNHDTACSQ